MGAPQVIFIVILALSAFLNLTRWGKAKDPSTYGFTGIIDVCIFALLLIEGGFFE